MMIKKIKRIDFINLQSKNLFVLSVMMNKMPNSSFIKQSFLKQNPENKIRCDVCRDLIEEEEMILDYSLNHGERVVHTNCYEEID